MQPGAARAQATDLDDTLLNRETRIGRGRQERIGDAVVMQFDRGLAGSTDHELNAVRFARIAAAHIRVQGLDAMHETLKLQELQGAIDGRRLRDPR